MAALAAVLGFLAVASSQVVWTALDEYVATPDSTYKYENLNISIGGLTWRGNIVKMYSQTWLTPSDWNRGNAPDPDPGVWWHYVTLIEPTNVDSTRADTVLLYITAGRNDNPPPTSITDLDVVLASSMAVALRMRAVILYQIPNQPIVFPSDPNKKQELKTQ